MLECFAGDGNATPIILINSNNYAQWFDGQDDVTKAWLVSVNFQHQLRTPTLVPDRGGGIGFVAYQYKKGDVQEFGGLPKGLPAGLYKLENEPDLARDVALGWAFECYEFGRFKSSEKPMPQLVWSDQSHEGHLAEAVYKVRDLINRPANDLNPPALAAEATELTKRFGAEIRVIAGEDLLKENFPAVYAVGKAGPTPQLIDMHWGDPSHPAVTLVGKGVCFDSGGLNLKPAQGIQLMKKDMGGAANALGLAQLIMGAGLPVRLRLIIAAVENGVAKDAMRPGDIISTRKGLTIEVGNTDAEGRLILADCLTLAMEEKPELLIDFATLTGAARVALGTDLPALFVNDDDLADKLLKHGQSVRDEMWRMPLWKDYHRHIETKVAHLSNNPSSVYGGAITAALFLENFIDNGTTWAHIDMMAWNMGSRPGRPEGGEAMAMRAIFSYLQETYGSG